MTKEEVGTIIKRYPYIAQAVRESKDCAVFYVGNRKFSYAVTCTVKAVCVIIQDVTSRIGDGWPKWMVEGMLSGKSDLSLIMELPCSKNAFYSRKDNFYNTVYMGCAAKNIISYEEALENGERRRGEE